MLIQGTGETGSLNQAKVNDDGHLETKSVALTAAAHFSEDEMLWSWRGAGNFDAADTWLLVCNTSRDKLLRIQRIIIGTDAISRCQIHCPAFPTLAGTLVTPIRRKNPLFTTIQPDAVGYQDETGNTQANVITELLLLASTSFVLEMQGELALGYHESVAVDFTADITYGSVSVVGWFE